MNKVELIEEVADITDVDSKTVKKIADGIVTTIKNAIAKHDEVIIPSFGKFYNHPRKEHQGRNPNTGETITVPAKNYPRFTSSIAFKRVVNAL